jgi:hypothetical protein
MSLVTNSVESDVRVATRLGYESEAILCLISGVRPTVDFDKQGSRTNQEVASSLGPLFSSVLSTPPSESPTAWSHV